LVKVGSGNEQKDLFDEAVSYSKPIEGLPPSTHDPFSTMRIFLDGQLLSLNVMTSSLASASDSQFDAFSIEFLFAQDEATENFFRIISATELAQQDPVDLSARGLTAPEFGTSRVG
jgi:hypothetical protein